MGVTMNKPQRGVDRLVVHVQAVADLPDRRSPRDRLADQVGPELASTLLTALTGDQGIRRRVFAA
jgi:hypothetical protein